MAVIVIIVALAAVMIIVTVMAVVMVIPVRMVSVVIVIVVRAPGVPVTGIITPMPGGPPYYISWTVHKPDYRPCCDIIIAGANNIYIAPALIPGISRIGCFGIDGFNNIIASVEGLIPDQLDLHFPVAKFFHNKNSDVLLLVFVQRRAQYNIVYFIVNKI